MSDDHVGLLEAPTESERIIGRVRGNAAGPTMIVMSGIHGNEPAGVRAARTVCERLQRDRLPLRGQWIALAGNRHALRARSRFIDKDLNRQWTEQRVEELRLKSGPRSREDDEQLELLDTLLELTGSATGQVFFLDLHTSSADGPPFVTVGDTLRNRAFAMSLPLPVILGLEEQVDGALLEFMNNRGHVTMGVEAGHHAREDSVDHHEAVLWLALVASGMLGAGQLADRERYAGRLERASRGIPRIVEVRRRHAVRAGDGFRMEPGFVNFQPVTRGQLLARDRNGEIRCPESGLILLPLYQGQGDDGFFIGRAVSRFWLTLSAWLRRTNLFSWLHLLPGVRRHPRRPETLIVDTRVARLYPLEVFHLFGYRKRRQEGPQLIVARRRFDRETRPARRYRN